MYMCIHVYLNSESCVSNDNGVHNFPIHNRDVCETQFLSEKHPEGRLGHLAGFLRILCRPAQGK